jgi:hypothetical protein
MTYLRSWCSRVFQRLRLNSVLPENIELQVCTERAAGVRKVVVLAIMMVSAIFYPTMSASAQMRQSDGLAYTSRLPSPTISEQMVLLDVPHIRQKAWLCVPTSAAMILKYFGDYHDPQELKSLSENHKRASKRNANFTFWVDMRHALRSIGKKWKIQDYPKTSAGFRRGFSDIKRSLRVGNPVMVDVHLGQGHTFVVIGYNENEQVVYVRDPDIPSVRSRAIPYENFKANWHNHRFANSRSAFFTNPN